MLELLDLGATVHRLVVGGRDVVLGYGTRAEYLASTSYVGGTIGRYANRIARGRFELDGGEVRVAANDRGHHLHGGPEGFDRRIWELVEHGPMHAVLRIVSPDGDQGFPGELTATARFEALEDRIAIDLTAVTDAPTVVNLTSHAYFDLGGDHELSIPAQAYTPVDATGIPVSGHAAVAGTPYDFRTARPIGDTAIDHNFVVDGTGVRTAAVLASKRTGTRVEVRSDQPGLQVYTGGALGGVALEPQRYPDSPNHPGFPSAVLRPGETYRSRIEWVFARLPV